MMNALGSASWSDTDIGSQATLQRGFDITKAAQIGGSVPVISSGGTSSFHNVAMVKAPGVVLGRKGVVGSVYYCEQDFWPHDTTLWVKDFHGNDPRFVYYFFRSIADELALLDVGSANPTLNRNHVHPMRVLWPKLSVQLDIARILGALDDKIELNRRMNRTLEALAQKLFKSWFVDFDPVLAKSQNRKPFGLADEIAALFPDTFEDSELGPIPKGWRVESLDTLAEFRNGLAMQKFPPGLGASLPVLKIAELRAGSTNGADQASADLDPRYVVNDGDLIFSWSGSLMVDIWAGGQAALNQHLFKVVPNGVPRWFCHYWLLEHLEDFQGIASDKATTMGHIRRHHLSDAQIARPDERVLAHADSVIAPLCERVLQNKLQSRKLAAMRDLLLPKLLSGEIRVPVAETEVESVLKDAAT